MDRLARTRSQHFVHSPRRISSPLKLRHGSTVNRNPTKRRRLGSAAQHPFARNATTSASIDSDTDGQDDDEHDLPGPSRHRQRVLDPEAGAQNVNLIRHAQTNGAGAGKKDVKGKGRAVVIVPPPAARAPPGAVIFSSEEEEGSSPRKRKRTHSGSDTSSWIEMDEDEAEPEFIAEGDQHLIDEAPAYALHRLRKAELIRLWKVAGMWPGDDGIELAAEGEEDVDVDDGSLSKRELVDGLIGARKPLTSAGHSPSRRPTALGQAFELVPRTTTSGSASRESSASSDEGGFRDIDNTPRAVPRTRAKGKVRLDAVSGTPLARRVQVKGGGGVRERLLKSRSKSMGGPGEREERKARFGDHVKSPAKGLLKASTMSSSTYTTTDTSPPITPVNSRSTSTRRPRRSAANVADRRRGSRSTVHDDEAAEMREESDDAEQGTESSASDEADPTPLIQRLRPRTRSLATSDHVSEADADGEEEEEDDDEIEEGSLFSPGPSSRLRSRDRTDSDIPMSADSAPPTRGAKAKAKEALKGGEAADDMDIDDTAVDAVPNGHTSPAKQPPRPAHKRHTRRNSRLLPSPDPTDEDDDMPASAASSALTPPPASNGDIDTIDEETENEGSRTTRSGKAFGVWQSRRRRLRQEALDDPDMDVDDDEEPESDEEEDDSFEADVDLTDATVSSLTRMLRDELVQACEARGIEVGGTKPQLAKALLEWRDEQNSDAKSTTSSQATARPSPTSSGSRANPKTRRPNGKIIHAIGSNVHKSGQTTPVLLRDHVHAHDPATPPPSDGDSKKTTGEAELNLDLQELGLEDSVIRPDLLVKLERIGSGGFKDVYVGKYKNRKVAISEFREHLSEMDIRELKLLSEFRHPNIVKFRGICIPEDNSQIPCMLVSELCENGDLFDYIRNVERPTLKRLLGLMLDIARGLEYLHTHSPPIIHRDCKSSNILINRAGQAKVGDFGLARVKNSTRSMIRSLVGTVNWQAPELWSPKPQYDYKVDVFSAALVFWEMLSGWTGDKKYPWEGHNEHYIYDAVGHKHKRPSTAGLRKHWGAEPVNLMERMWHQDSKERPTMTDVVTDLEVLYAAA